MLADALRPPPSRWWDDRWAWRGAFAAAPFGALAAILVALGVFRASYGDALLAYLLGAAVAAGVGCLLGGPLGGALHARRSRPARQPDPYPDEPAAGRQLTLEEAGVLAPADR